jgi:NAD(P)-dependent dehydrogenase (short-subunit alcohol dehydrogenase family)
MQAKAVILTGAGGGVGRDACATLAKRGYHVYAGVIDSWEMEEVSKIKQSLGLENLEPVMLDLRKHDQIAAVVLDIETKGLELAGLVLNGAAAPQGVPAEHTSPELLRDVMETNVIGNFAAVQRCLPLLKQSHGRIVFVSSATTFAPPPMVLPYVTSKCAINSLAHVFRRELRNTGVKVCLLLPGVIKNTYMSNGLHESTKQRLAQIRGCAPESISSKNYDAGHNSALMQPVGGADPFYEDMLQGQLNTIQTGIETGFLPSLVTRYIMTALEIANPKPVYVVGVFSHVFNFLSWLLPFKWMDYVTVKMGYR